MNERIATFMGLVFLVAAAHVCCNAAESDNRGRGDAGSGGDFDAGSDFDGGADADADADGDADTDTDADAGPGFVSPATCEEAMETRSNIGCEYWAADLDNAENNLNGQVLDNAAGAQFAVAVANIADQGAVSVQVHLNNAPQGEPLDLELVEEAKIPEKDLFVFKLPRRDVDGDNVKVGVDDGPQTWLSSRAFRITSDKPVVAYQFNPYNQKFSNDASLLIPTSALGVDHLVLGYFPGPLNRGYVTVIGTEDNTSVEVIPTFDIIAGEGIDEIKKGELASFQFGRFDVINLETRLLTTADLPKNFADLTGTVVRSDKPVAVFFGTDLSLVNNPNVTDDSCCAEHLEQQVIPSEAMGYKFVVSHSAQRNAVDPEEDLYRVISYSDDTVVTTNLAGANASFNLAKGELHEFFSTTGFTLESNKPLHVAQLLVAQGDTEAVIGDSALLYVPAVDQRRGLYLFTTGQGFTRNHAVISMPEGTSATIDGVDVKTSPSCRGPLVNGVLEGVTYEEWTCDVEHGVHTVHSGLSPETAKTPIGVFCYGYYNAGSYAYPAGSDLRRINKEIVE